MHPKITILAFSLLALVSSVHSRASTVDWQSLNETLGGRLNPVTPWAKPCFVEYNGQPSEPLPQACAVIQDQYQNGTYRADHFSSYIYAQSELCVSKLDQQCQLDPTDPSNASEYSDVSCNQGSLAQYFIQVETADDVAAAYSFSARTDTRLVIKNSGHDYNGRNTGPMSLALWTRGLQNITYHDSFTPTRCSIASIGMAITMGAGVNFDEAYTFAHQNNVTILGGSSPTVGASGAWVMTAGHSVLSPAYGLGVDRVVEFEVVTPDGQRRIANTCQNPDLFWALRGGGGGTFGVVLSSTHRVEPALTLAVAAIAFPSNVSTIVSGEFLRLILNHTLSWAAEGWGGYQSASEFVLVNPLLSIRQAQSSMAELVDFAIAHGGSASVVSVPDFYTFYTQYVRPSALDEGTVTFSHDWFIPSHLLATADGQQRVHEHLNWMTSVGLTPGLLTTTPYLYSGNGGSRSRPFAYAYGPADSTSTGPAWRNSVALLSTTTEWPLKSSMAERQALAWLLVEASERAASLAPVRDGGGAYPNEAHPWVNDWQDAFWGANYGKLLALKQQWDPKSLLSCWHCVGSETRGVDGYCLGDLLDYPHM